MLYEISQFLADLFVASIMILLTSIIHGFGLHRIMTYVGRRAHKTSGSPAYQQVRKVKLLVFAILGIFALITVHIWLWAVMYKMLNINELKTLEDSVYFSTVSFTTLGFGDIVLKDQWRILSGIEAANGIVLLGWSTAFLIEVMGAVYPRFPRQN